MRQMHQSTYGFANPYDLVTGHMLAKAGPCDSSRSFGHPMSIWSSALIAPADGRLPPRRKQVYRSDGTPRINPKVKPG